MTTGAGYTVTMNHLTTASGDVLPTSLQFSFSYAPQGTGSILREYWTNIGNGTAVTDLTSNANYPNNPSGRDLLRSFEAPTNWADAYGTRIRGYLSPPMTGYYTFWIASDDNGELWLSTDDNPANKVKIAYVTCCHRLARLEQQQQSDAEIGADLLAGGTAILCRSLAERKQRQRQSGRPLAIARWKLGERRFDDSDSRHSLVALWRHRFHAAYDAGESVGNLQRRRPSHPRPGRRRSIRKAALTTM